MSTIDKQLIGNNLCNMDCVDTDKIIHPETNTNQVLIGGDSDVNITDWVGGNAEGSFTDYENLKAWLAANYPSSSYTLPIAGNSTLGGVKIATNNQYLNVDSESGYLTFNASSIPSINTASYSTSGTVKLGYSTNISSATFGNTNLYENTEHTYCLPLRLDANNRAGIEMPKSLISFTQAQANWNQNDSYAVDYIKNKPVIPTVNNSLITIIQGENSYEFTLNQGTGQIIELSDGGTAYTAGTNIQINDGVISATDTTYTAGTNININSNTINYNSTPTMRLYTGTGSIIDCSTFVQTGISRNITPIVYIDIASLASNNDLTNLFTNINTTINSHFIVYLRVANGLTRVPLIPIADATVMINSSVPIIDGQSGISTADIELNKSEGNYLINILPYNAESHPYHTVVKMTVMIIPEGSPKYYIDLTTYNII